MQNNKGRPTAEFVLQLLERIPERQRDQILASACRMYPTLDHPRLKCDQTIISRLKSIVCQTCGLAFIQGGDDESRTFLLTAMGHAFLGLTARPHGLAGLDVHEPDWFVPLPGVRYIQTLFEAQALIQLVSDYWAKLPAAGSHLAVFNMSGLILADFQRQLKALTAAARSWPLKRRQ